MNTPSPVPAGTPDPIHLPLQMLIVFGSAKLLAELAERLRMPGIVGGLLAGILIGPSALGWIQYDSLLHALAELGVMFLLFQVGLEVKATELMRAGKTAMIVAMLGVILPFILGWAIMLGAGHPHLESIFMGAAMVATSVGITAQVLAGKGLLKHRTAQIILAAAVIDDVLGLLVLAVVSSMGEGKGIDFLGLATTAVVSIGFVVAVAKFGTRTVNIVLPKMMEKSRAQEGEFAIAVCFLFIMALLATYSGVAAIVGAFLAGMALAEIASHRLHTLVQGAGELMIPFFLASIGLQLDLRIFSSPSTLGLAVVILLAAVVSKAVGCGLGAYGLGLKDATRIGLGMVPRGEVGMVVAQVGLSKGNISQEVYGIAVFMAVMTTIVAPPLLSFAYRDLAVTGPAGEDDQPHVRLG
ncbi:cation:proton antiporter [Paludibaculum fermentans]|uniref:Cation:proton antiporter n=1 Tax=Paludibaculum fermentans TaxID=1473598 RepID=A0A7S7NXA6_PALFE|nr:cation:proton antiporter [Paludibaculum fermentans]QOY91451.1 cation:proton antiporter [Paludibaculum fermentans]